MNAPSPQHVWGVSPAADRVWSQVSGLAPNKARERLFVVLQAFIDDSYKPDGVFVLGGYIASAEAWANFSKEWEEILPYGLRNKDGAFYFKMSEMALTPERMRRVPAFYRVIENNTLMALSCAVDLGALKRARERISIPRAQIDWSDYANPYLVTFRHLLDLFHVHRLNIPHRIPLDEKIDFYFDNQTEKKIILSTWDQYINSREDQYKKFYGATPRFEDDLDFLPLQAADLWAWWARKFEEEGRLENIKTGDFGAWKHIKRGYFVTHITFTEEHLVENLTSILRGVAGDEALVCDIRYHVGGERV
jgi:hypothetical protein